MHIIGLLGRARCGKDTVADIIRELYPKYTIQRFAEPIKVAVGALYGFTREQMEGDEKETLCHAEWGVTPREAMQFVTKIYMEKHGDAFFSRRVLENTGDIIIPDVRYRRDVERIKSTSAGIVIKIIRPLDSLVLHQTEDSIDGLEGDYTIINDSDIAALRSRVIDIMRSLIEKSTR